MAPVLTVPLYLPHVYGPCPYFALNLTLVYRPYPYFAPVFAPCLWPVSLLWPIFAPCLWPLCFPCLYICPMFMAPVLTLPLNLTHVYGPYPYFAPIFSAPCLWPQSLLCPYIWPMFMTPVLTLAYIWPMFVVHALILQLSLTHVFDLFGCCVYWWPGMISMFWC